MTVRIIEGDCLEVMPTLEAESLDAIVTDPPYGLSFMGKAWDHGVPGQPFWAEALRVAKPGTYLCAFGGTRTFHRLTSAIEDAGWQIQDCLSWLYGSGFPKHRSKLKPAWEPVVLAWKPDAKATPLNIDACRIAVTDSDYARNASGDRGHDANRKREMEFGMTAGEAHGGGRWPANVVLDEEAATMLDEQTGVLTSGANPARRGAPKFRNTYGTFEGQTECSPVRGLDSGGASRFFYTAKASRSEREYGLDGERKSFGYSGGAAAAVESGADYEEAQTIGLNRVQSVRNNHPTVKPVELMRWLCRLVTPVNGLILDPFTGSGTTGVAATLEGFRFLGIEKEAEYVEIARRRIAEAPPSLFGEVA